MKLSEESEIPQEYWGSPEDELQETSDRYTGGMKEYNRVVDNLRKTIRDFYQYYAQDKDELKRILDDVMYGLDDIVPEYPHMGKGVFGETEEVPSEKPEDGDFIEGGLADDEHLSKYDPQQISMGIEVEMEHTNDPKVALEIAMDHLEEIPDYYTHLDKMEKEAGVEEPEGEAPEPMEGMMDNTAEDQEITDELLGYKPHNVGDYTKEEFDVPQSPEQERQYWDKEYYKQDQEIQEPADPDVGHADYLKKSGQMKSFDDASQKQEIIDEEGGFDEYAGDVGDRYEDANNNQFTVRDKVEGGVTLQGQGGEKEIATSDLQFLKKLSESEQIDLARQVLKNRRLDEGMTKKLAVQVLIKHNIK